MSRRTVRTSISKPDSPGMAAMEGWSSALLTALGGLLLWLAFPPVGWNILAWIAPVPWLMLCRKSQPLTRRNYFGIWIGSLLFWLVLLQGIRKAHPANYLGLLALSSYLSVYLPAFVAIARTAVHHQRIPLWLAAPVIWTAFEFIRGGLFTGFSVALLGHTQVNQVWLIQIADVTGASGVSFLMMLFAASLEAARSHVDRARRWIPLATSVALIAATLGYGWWRIHSVTAPVEAPLKVALLQGTRDKIFSYNPELEQQSFRQYFELMKRARAVHPDLDLIVWPEGAFTASLPELIARGTVEPPTGSGLSLSEIQQNIEQRQQAFADKLRATAAEANRGSNLEIGERGKVHLILGATTFELQGSKTRNFNSALCVDPFGQITERYYKMHLVMFGEYIPFARVLPWLANWTPIGQGVTPGERPASFEVKGYRLAPSICFESTVPHVIRDQVVQLSKESGKAPDILINITDDGWFWGSNILDLHLACAIFRAVEMRRPFLVAANTGISANIDGSGRVLERLPHRREGFIVADVRHDDRISVYERCGELFSGLCAITMVWWTLRAYVAWRASSPNG